MAAFVGMELGDENVSVAAFDPTTGPIAVPPPRTEGKLPFRVACQQSRRDGRRVVNAIFPTPDEWREDAQSMVFDAIRTNLPAYRNRDVQGFLLRPVFEFWREAVSAEEARLSVAVPLEYSRDICEMLQMAARESGFTSCACVQEPLAVILAYLPLWLGHSGARELLNEGQCVWLLESSYLDLNVALLHVHCNKADVHVTYLAGDCLEGFGSSRPLDLAHLQEEIQKAHPRLLDAGFGLVWPNWPRQIPPPTKERASWVVCSGEGPSLEPSRAFLEGLLSRPNWVVARLPNEEVVRRGTAVHAAIQGQQLPYRIRTVGRRVVGLRMKADTANNFIGLTEPGADPPSSFERAFEIPGPIATEVEVTLAAALPGGDRCGDLRTFSFHPSMFTDREQPVLIVSGVLESWVGGTVLIHEARSGKKLAEGRFQL